jgi:hypothetical protein
MGMHDHPLRKRFVRAVRRMSPLQREIASGLLTDEDDWADERLAERYGTTSGAVRIERAQARRFLWEVFESVPRRLR